MLNARLPKGFFLPFLPIHKPFAFMYCRARFSLALSLSLSHSFSNSFFHQKRTGKTALLVSDLFAIDSVSENSSGKVTKRMKFMTYLWYILPPSSYLFHSIFSIKSFKKPTTWFEDHKILVFFFRAVVRDLTYVWPETVTILVCKLPVAWSLYNLVSEYSNFLSMFVCGCVVCALGNACKK